MQLWIAGAGGVGREALDVAIAGGTTVDGFLDSHAAGSVRGLPVLHPDDVPSDAAVLVAIGDPVARRRVAEELARLGAAAKTLMHPRAIVGPETAIGDGCLVSGGVYISSSVTMGDHVQVHYNATVGHDCDLGVTATVLPGANVAGAVTLEAGATVGSGAVVLQGLRIGAGATVGAGAVVTHDVDPATVVVGSPARPIER